MSEKARITVLPHMNCLDQGSSDEVSQHTILFQLNTPGGIALCERGCYFEPKGQLTSQFKIPLKIRIKLIIMGIISEEASLLFLPLFSLLFPIGQNLVLQEEIPSAFKSKPHFKLSYPEKQT